ncbi:MAG: hypothetical protein A2431_01260 [Candidatus Zambryskibacteria bacterium RIFOXYC1_FULL_39_10]|uniref:Uncharacterized protein n=1 Tax=Candidatus Zambryskibacteria bacterium RIFOXYC1_FULL_39_10 TaxID=1802779 RepID=A0A1G2UZA5_9BACT|nr:MAG: hypothetical protein A2431_01260 [Candidatus Zambryskibacteria bacterium RIFOXYC1_FULL_39_10]
MNDNAASLIRELKKRAEYYEKKMDRVKNHLIILGCLSKLDEIESLIIQIEENSKHGVVFNTIILEYVNEFIHEEAKP